MMYPAEILRKKWYNVYQKRKSIKAGKRQSGAGTVTWEFFQLMDELLVKDPTIAPPATLTTRPFERRPLRPVDPENTTGVGALPSVSDASLDAAKSQTGASPKVRPTRRHRNPAAEDENVELKRALLNDLKERKAYRDEKL